VPFDPRFVHVCRRTRSRLRRKWQRGRVGGVRPAFPRSHCGGGFSYHNPLGSKFASSDYFRAQHSQKRGSGQPESSTEEEVWQQQDESASPSEGDAQRKILLREVDEALCSVPSSQDAKRDRAIFFLYYRYGLTAPAIARLPSVNLTAKGVESVIYRLTQAVRERLAERNSTLSE